MILRTDDCKCKVINPWTWDKLHVMWNGTTTVLYR